MTEVPVRHTLLHEQALGRFAEETAHQHADSLVEALQKQAPEYGILFNLAARAKIGAAKIALGILKAGSGSGDTEEAPYIRVAGIIGHVAKDQSSNHESIKQAALFNVVNARSAAQAELKDLQRRHNEVRLEMTKKYLDRLISQQETVLNLIEAIYPELDEQLDKNFPDRIK
jgi:hypothetical protein